MYEAVRRITRHRWRRTLFIESEVEEVLRGRGEDLRATGNSRRKIDQTLVGRYLQVFYVPDEDSESVFVITAYEPQGKAKKAFRRRQRRKPK